MTEHEEMITAYTNDERNGTAMPRELVHKAGIRHDSVHVILYGLRDGVPVVWLQKRAAAKKLFPGMWDFTATGHPAYGEPAKQAALRELEEETGLKPDIKSLRALEAYRQITPRPDGGLDDETVWAYALRIDGVPDLKASDEAEAFASVPVAHFSCLLQNSASAVATYPDGSEEIIRASQTFHPANK